MGILTDRIYSGLERLDKEEKAERATRKKVATSLTASIITACRRANWYHFKKIGEDKGFTLDQVVLSKFWDGRVEHELLSELFRNIGIKVLDKEFGKVCEGIYARVDYLLEINEKLYDLEFKTASESSFATYCKHGVQAFPGNYSQCQVILGAKPFRPLILAVKCKSTSEYYDEVVERNPEYIANLVKIRSEFDTSLKKDMPPERDFTYNSDVCAGCEYRFRCWFSHIRADMMVEGDLTENEKSVVNQLFKQLRLAEETHWNYVDWDKELKDYVAFLHTKHSVAKVRIEGVTSSLVVVNKETPNLDYVRSVLTEEELELAFTTRESKFFRTIYNLGDGK